MSLEELEALLVVQEHDLALDRLRHQHATLPERAELEARTRELAARTSERADVQARRDVVHAEERKLDDEARDRRRARRRGEFEALLRDPCNRRANCRRCRPTSRC